MLSSNLAARVLDLAVAIQQIPAPTFHEQARAAFVRDLFQEEQLQDVSIDRQGNVFARLPGSGTAAPLVISAHTDTVFPLETSLAVQRADEKIFGPGIGDNSLGVAGLFGLVWGLRQKNRPHPLPGDLWLAANVCEEGLGDLRGMQAVVQRFGGLASAFIILEGMSLGQIYHRGLGVQRYRIRVETGGGHSWVDYGRPSAVHELAKLIHSLDSLPVARRPRTTLNVGVISGGTTVNTIAAQAELELDLRSESAQCLADLVERVEKLAAAANRKGVQVRAEVIGRRPSGKIAITHPLVQLARRCLEAQGIDPCLSIGSTDANIPLSLSLPAVCVGISNGGGAHTLQEYIQTAPVGRGLEQLVALAEGVFD